MYGMNLMSSNLQKLSTNKVRDLLNNLNHKKLQACALGAVLSILLQSGVAVNSMLVGLASAGVIQLSQVMGVVLGSFLGGSTLMVQVLSLQITSYGLGLFGFSFLLSFVAKNKARLARALRVGMGFGLMLLGLEWIGLATTGLGQSALFVDLLKQLSLHPFASVIGVALFSAMAHSAAPAIGLAMSLVASGLLNLTDAVYWIYGANLGTSFTVLLSALGRKAVARQVAAAGCLFKLCTFSLLFFITPLWVPLLPAQGALAVALSHAFFNVACVLMSLPFCQQAARVLEKIFVPSKNEQDYTTKFLTRQHFSSTPVIITHARRESLRMADVFLSMLRDVVQLLKNENRELSASIKERDNRVDFLNREIMSFLAENMNSVDPQHQSEMLDLVSFVTDVESAADVIDNNLKDLAKKKHRLKLEFADDTWFDVEALHEETLSMCTMACGAFQTAASYEAQSIIEMKREIRKLEHIFRRQHIQRLAEGLESPLVSPIYLDILAHFRRISGLCSHHLYRRGLQPLGAVNLSATRSEGL